MKIYDKKNKRLILLEKKANSEFWDKHWELKISLLKLKKVKNNRFIRKFTNKFLSPGVKVLEGGCGIGQNVLRARRLGIRCLWSRFCGKHHKKGKAKFSKIKVVCSRC